MKYEDPISAAIQFDRADPLARFREEFVLDDPNRIYLDGNSLGRLPKRTRERVNRALDAEWGHLQVEAWSDWIDVPKRVGAKIAQLIGADANEVLVCDSTSVNLYKLTMAALALRPDRQIILTDSANFPSDLYLMQGCAKQVGKTVVVCEPGDVIDHLSDNVALLSLTHCAFKTGKLHDMNVLTEAAHDQGALVLWDLSHSAGAVPLTLNEHQVDVAVGCTYKYLNGGPGSPAYLFVREDMQESLSNPIWGWFGQKRPFDFSLEYEAADGIQRFMTGTPSILSMVAIEAGVDLLLEAGMKALREKSIRQTEFLIQLWQDQLLDFGVSLNSPTLSSERGSHISLGHPMAYQIDQALIKEKKVIPDFRTPDNIRFGITPIYTTYLDIAEAILRFRQVMESGSYQGYPAQAIGVT